MKRKTRTTSGGTLILKKTGYAMCPQDEFPLHTTEEAARIMSDNANGFKSRCTETRKLSPMTPPFGTHVLR